MKAGADQKAADNASKAYKLGEDRKDGKSRAEKGDQKEHRLDIGSSASLDPSLLCDGTKEQGAAAATPALKEDKAKAGDQHQSLHGGFHLASLIT